MLIKIGQHVKLTICTCEIFFSLNVYAQNNKSIDVGSPTQKATDMHSSRLGPIFLQCYPHLFNETNGHMSIGDSPLTENNEKVFSS